MTINRQEAFDKSTRGIIAQGGPAISGNKCAYRTPEGRKCAAGQLMPDDKYNRHMEGRSVAAEEVRTAFGFQPFSPDTKEDTDLWYLRALQGAHDEAAIVTTGLTGTKLSSDAEFWPLWRGNLRKLAENYDLDGMVTLEIPA